MTNPQITDRQKAFITRLLAEREVAQDLRDSLVPAELEKLSLHQASSVIDLLLNKPHTVAALVAPGAGDFREQLRVALEAVPHSKYALPLDEIAGALTNTVVTGDLLFVETKKYNGHTYIRRLHGAPGDFTRSRIATADSLAILAIIATDSKKYSVLFGQHYQCCGKCGAPLTDETSRKLFLGPVCRNAWA